MQLGDFLLWLAMVTTALSAIAYIAAGFGRKQWVSLARMTYYAMATATIGVSAYLMALIFQGRFDVSYVYSYTSKNLEPLYKISAFWAGQEGSFLLWALFGAIIGLFLIRKSGKYEPWLMAFWSVLQAFFFTLLLIRSPFASTLSQVPGASLLDGQGLNPLLKNPWMAIHPPFVFLGYAAMAVPAAFVVAALIRGDYETWAKDSLPWTLFAWITLGAGIFLGGYWAYEVLGWGGYWGWDPVENASLVPWLTGTALLHGLLVERSRKTLKRTNMVMAIISFLLIIYATFLTRSGVLGDFSVHSFSDLGVNGYLIGFMSFFTLLSVCLYVWRARKIEGGAPFASMVSKEFAFFVTIIILAISAGLITFGTSNPLFTKWFGKAQSVPPEFYIRTNTPVAIVLVLLMALAPVLAWGRNQDKNRKGLSLAVLGIAASLVAAFAALIAGFLRHSAHNPLSTGAVLAVGLISAVALISNGVRVLAKGKSNLKSIGGFTAHAGIALMFMGILLSSSSGQPHKLMLPQNGLAKTWKGYSFAYIGKDKVGEQKEAMKIRVKGRGLNYIARPMLQPARDGMMRSPAIHKGLTGDIYIAPIENGGAVDGWLAQGEPAELHGVTYQFERFVMGGVHTQDSIEVGAEIKVTKGGETTTVTPKLILKGDKRDFIDATVPGAAVNISLQEMNVDQHAVHVAIGPSVDSVIIEVSKKPWISLLWLGALLTLIGGCIAMWRRSTENATLADASVETVAEAEGTPV